MKLIANHYDGFTEHLVGWTLEACGGEALIDASWHTSGGRVEKMFEMVFPESRIQLISDALSGLKPVYDGHVDDFPTYSLRVITGSDILTTKVHAGIEWPLEDKLGIETFLSVWRPLQRDVEMLLAIPGRQSKSKRK